MTKIAGSASGFESGSGSINQRHGSADPDPNPDPDPLQNVMDPHSAQCCGSGMFIPDPDFYPSRIPDLGSRIPDPKTATKERGEKK